MGLFKTKYYYYTLSPLFHSIVTILRAFHLPLLPPFIRFLIINFYSKHDQIDYILVLLYFSYIYVFWGKCSKKVFFKYIYCLLYYFFIMT